MNRDMGHPRQEVNFVPAWYAQQSRRRQIANRTVALMALMVIGSAVLAHQTHRRYERLSEVHRTVDAQLQANQVRSAAVQELRAEHAAMTRQYDVYRKLYQGVTFTQLIGTLASLTPHEVTLDRMDVATRQVRIEREATAAELARAESSKKRKSQSQRVVETHPAIAVELTGVAPSDVVIANFVATLAECPLFEEVALQYSRQGQRGERMTREFRISMRTPINCLFEWVEASRETEAADAN